MLFLPVAAMVLIMLPQRLRGFIWLIDGMSQYYPNFVYEGMWIRGIVGNLLSGNGLQVPLWEWTSGYGSDVPTTFDCFLDPLNLVSAITPPVASEWVFHLLVLTRLYLAGLAFVFYARTRKEDRAGTVLGALLYALGGMALTAIRWPGGLHALILFPVVLAGAERVLAGGKPWLYLASLTALTIISYYFSYMACILLVGYLALRVVMVERPHLTIGRFMRWVGVFAGLTALSLLLASFALIPAATTLLNMGRVTERSTATLLMYPYDTLLNLLSIFMATTEVGSDTYVGFGGLAFVACLACLACKGENRELKLVLVALTAGLFIPAVGSLFNAMNYATNRWVWAYALCVSLVVARMTPKLWQLSAADRKKVVAGVVAYELLLLLPGYATLENMGGAVALLAALVVVLRLPRMQDRNVALGLTMALTLATSGYFYIARFGYDIVSLQAVLGTAYPMLTTNSADSVALLAPRDSWWRYDAGQPYPDATQPVSRLLNNNLVLGLNGIDFYNSVYNDNVDAFHTELGVVGTHVNFSYGDLQGRSDLMSLLGVRYYAYRKDGSDTVPYGFSKDREVAQRTVAGHDYRLLESDGYLPMGSTFGRVLSRTDYLSLPTAKRQQALLQAVVLEDDAAARSPLRVRVDDLAFEDRTVPFTIAEADGVTVGDHTLDVAHSGASVLLEFAGTPSSDTFLHFSGLSFRQKKPSENVPADELARMPLAERLGLSFADYSQKDFYTYAFDAHSNAVNMICLFTNYLPTNHMYGGKDTWLFELGYDEGAASRIRIEFSDAGVYTFDDLQVVTQTHEHKAAWIASAREQTLQQVELGCNRLSGTVDLDGPKVLFIPVAYNRGWSATVDGREAKVLCADTGFMALELDAGHHEIVLSYFTPGLALGFALSGAGVVVLVALVLVLRRKDASSQLPDESTSPKEP